MTELYRNVFYLSPGICCIFSKSTLQLQDLNANFERLLQVSHDEAVIEKLGNFIARTDDKEYFESIVKGLNQEKPHHELDEIEFIIDNDETLIVKCNLTLLDVDGLVSLRGEVIKARSSHNMSHDASRKSSLTVDSSFMVPFMPMDQMELHTLFHRIPVGFHCVNTEGRILYANDTLLNILGYSYTEYVGKPITDFVEAQLLLPMVQRIKNGELVHNYPYIFRAKDGTMKTCLADSDLKLNPDGTGAHSRTFFRYDVDRIVDQAIANERIAKLGMIAAEKDRFIRIIFHEIRTPLHNLSTRINNTLKQSNIPQVFVDEMRFQIDSCTGLVEDLSFATMFESDQVLHPRPVDMRIRKELENIIQYINMFHEAEVTKKQIKIQKIVDVHIPDVISVDKSILRVLHNLIHNAVKFCCPGGVVLINLTYIDEARDGENNFIFTVSNTVSKPMDLVHINKLFQNCYHSSYESNLTEDLLSSNNSSFFNYTTASEDGQTLQSVDSPSQLLLRRSDSPFSPAASSGALRRLDSPLPKLKGPGIGGGGGSNSNSNSNSNLFSANPIARLKNDSSSQVESPRTGSPRRTDSPVQRLRHEISRVRADSNNPSPSTSTNVPSAAASAMGELGQKMNLHLNLDSNPNNFQPVHLAAPEDATTKKFDSISSSLTSNEGLGLGLYVSYNIIQSLGGLLEVAGNEKESCFTFSIHVDAVTPKTTPVATGPTRLLSVFGSKGAAWSNITNSSVGNKHLVDVVVPDPPPVTPASSSSAGPTPIHRLSTISSSSALSVSSSGPLKISPRLPPVEMARSDSNPSIHSLQPPTTPLTPAGPPISSNSSSSANLGSLSSNSHRLPRLARILIVDDSPICRKVLVKSLEVAGYLTDTACDGQEACDKLKPAPSHFDLVLMDLRMPIMDGLTATKICKSLPHLEHIPIVIVTAEMGEDIRDAAMNAQASHFISKPAKVNELLDVMMNLIKW